MSETANSANVNAQPKPKAAPRGGADGRVLAEVEKWMAMIREMNREPVKN
jgi:hypothetical protein